MEKTGFSREDTERQVKLLLHYRLIVNHTLFPAFPRQGWKVYTSLPQHQQIIRILRQHGYHDDPSRRTREHLGEHYPTGMALEGRGRQQDRGRTYPPEEEINEDLDYREQTITVMQEWRDMKPYRPKEFSPEAVREKKKKFQWLLNKLSDIYGIRRPTLRIGRMTAETWVADASSGSSCYNRITHTITLVGKFSVTTFLHEFAHARGFDETDAVMWSQNLFKRIFPISYSRIKKEGHMYLRGNPERPYHESD